MLHLALLGLSDEEIAAAHSVTVSAIKWRWMAIYARVQKIDSGFFPEAASDLGEGKRAAKKRHILLRYVHDHLEEVRPVNPPRQKITINLLRRLSTAGS